MTICRGIWHVSGMCLSHLCLYQHSHTFSQHTHRHAHSFTYVNLSPAKIKRKFATSTKICNGSDCVQIGLINCTDRNGNLQASGKHTHTHTHHKNHLITHTYPNTTEHSNNLVVDCVGQNILGNWSSERLASQVQNKLH